MTENVPARRSVLLSGAALAAAARFGFVADAAKAASDASPLLVRVTIDNKSYEFDERKGRDLGDYEGPGFVQRCIMVTVPDLPLSVLMRPDRNSDRVEVVIELGRMWNATPQPLGAYVVEIERGGKKLAHVEVPQHFWLSRWRWQSARRPLIGKVASLIGTGLFPPYSREPTGGMAPRTDESPPPHPASAASTPKTEPPASLPPQSAVTGLPPSSVFAGSLRRGANGELEVVAAPQNSPLSPQSPRATNQAASQTPAELSAGHRPPASDRTYSIMGLAGVMAYMPTTGDRRDIGPVTGPQAEWIGTGSGEALDDLMAQAEASGTVPWHMRDEKTGAPFDFNQYPKGGWFRDRPSDCNPYVPTIKSPVTPDDAHHPALTYVPFLLTGDPYFLEELQLQTTFCIGFVSPSPRLDNKCILSHTQTRAYAWCLRDLAQVAKVTPEKVPGWLKPRAYWAQFLENNRLWFEETFVRNQNEPARTFRTAPKYRDEDVNPGIDGKPTTLSPWEEEYFCFVLGWMVLMGHSSWRDIFAWKVGATIGRTNGTSGWGRAYAIPYMMCLRRSPTDPWPQSWKEAWDLNVQLQKWQITDKNLYSEKNTAYLCYTRAVLALATRLGIPGARECFSWADNVIQFERRDRIPYRWNVPA